MLGIGRTYFENIRNHLINNGLLPRIHGNIKRIPQWKTKMVIDKNVAEVVKNFLENYAEVHGLPSSVGHQNCFEEAKVKTKIKIYMSKLNQKSIVKNQN